MNPLQFAEIVDVRGIKVRAEVYTKKNTTMLIHYGEIVKNVSVGSYVKIVKGFTQIIGIVEGEYVNDRNNNEDDFISTEESFKRVIEIKILGTLDGEEFKRGITDMPLLYNPVFILSPKEFKVLFRQDSKSGEVSIGCLVNDESIRVNLDVNGVMNGHIGIFGNTGSGKSNTLTKLYKEVFILGESFPNFKTSSRFVFIDFNGEYINDSLSLNKKITYINTSVPDGEGKIDIRRDKLFRADMLSIILEATEKTQKPFIERCLKFNERQFDDIFTDAQTIIDNLGVLLFENKESIGDLQKYFNDLMKYLLHDDYNSYFNKYRFVKNPAINSLYTNETQSLYDIESTKKLLRNDLFNSFEQIDFNFSYQEKMMLSFNYKFLEEVGKGYINREHIAPLMKRLDRMFNLIKKVFNVIDEEPSNSNPINIINLKKANLEAKKIIPLIVCKSEYENHVKNNDYTHNRILNIVIDEAHNILSTQSDRESKEWKDYRIEVFEEIVKEGRKFGVFLTVASQRPSDISTTIISQLNHYFIHRLMNQEDLNRISKTVTFLDKNSFEMIPSLPPGGCILTGSTINFPILVQVDRLKKNERPNSDDYDIVSIWKGE